jgi:predicted amidohydrolase
VRIGACQTPDIRGDVPAALDVILDLAGRAEVDLLLFPECFLSGYIVTEQAFALDSPAFGAVLRRLATVRPMLVLGLIEKSGDHLFNTAAVIAGGRLVGTYRKRFLTPGESMFTAGDTTPTFACAGTRFGINICFDAQFPEAAAAVAAGGARVLLLPAQNMMPRDRALHWQPRHNEIRRRRVAETGLWLASSDVTGEYDGRLGLGPTCVLNPAGEVVAAVPPGATGVAVATVDEP